MSTFALVHGAWHGAWCWDLLVPELEARGHRAVTMDLPCDDLGAGTSEYANVVVDALQGTDDEVVLVGHSLGGLTIPVVAERRPVARMVFLAAIIPSPGQSIPDQYRVEPATHLAFHGATDADELGRRFLSAHAARTWLYHDCSEELAIWAHGQLRPQAGPPGEEVTPLRVWPAVPSSYVVCTEDRVIVADWARRAARDRLGTTAIELPGSHSPMLSRPADLAEVLVGL